MKSPVTLPRMTLNVRLFGLLVIFGCTGVYIPSAMAESDDFLVTGNLWCPYTCDHLAEKRGYIVEVVEAVFGAEGKTVVYKTVPWARSFSYTENGKAKAALAVVPGGAANFNLNREVLAVDNTVLVIKKGAQIGYSNPLTLDKFRIGVTATYTYDNEGPLDKYLAGRIANHDRIFEMADDDPLVHLLPMLIRRRIDLFLANSDVVHYKAANAGLLDKIDIVQTGHTDTIHVGFPRNDEGTRNLEILDEGIRQLRASGRLAEIKNSYGLGFIESNKTVN